MPVGRPPKQACSLQHSLAGLPLFCSTGFHLRASVCTWNMSFLISSTLAPSQVRSVSLSLTGLPCFLHSFFFSLHDTYPPPGIILISLRVILFFSVSLARKEACQRPACLAPSCLSLACRSDIIRVSKPAEASVNLIFNKGFN